MQVQIDSVVVDIHDVLYAPCANILSVKRLLDKGYKAVLEPMSAVITDRKRVSVFRAPPMNGLWILPVREFKLVSI